MGSNLIFIPCLLLVITIIPTVFSVDDHTGNQYIDLVCESTNDKITRGRHYNETRGRHYNESTNDKITRGSQYEANLHNLVNDLVANTSLNNGSMISSKGIGNETAYGRALCRHDVSSDGCNDCLAKASATIIAKCSFLTATIWYDHCLLTFSNHGDMSEALRYKISERKEYGGTFSDMTLGLFYKLVGEIASEGKTIFASGNATNGNATNGNGTVYAMAQCARDGSIEYSTTYLAVDMARELNASLPKTGARIYSKICVVRYEMFPFLLK